MQQKVLAYVLRRGPDGRRQLLVFDHRDYPDAGTQVPAGTVEPGEAIEAALWRELLEESGLAAGDLRLMGKLAAHTDAARGQQRHVFQLSAAGPLPDRWRHRVGGEGEDNGLHFDYYWLDLTPDLRLEGWQGEWLGMVVEAAGT